MLREKLTDAIKEHHTKFGDDFQSRFKKSCLHRLSPALQNTTMFMGNAPMFIKPKLIDGSPNPLWPEGVEAPPRDEAERKEFYSKLREAHLQDWLNRIEEGEFDRAPEILADPDPDVEERLSADDLDDEEEDDADIEARAMEERAAREAEPETETVSVDELEEEIAEQKAKPKESKLRLNSDYAKEQYAPTSHGNTMIGMLKAFIMDVIHHEVDTTAKESPRTSDDIMKLIDENIALKNAMLKLGSEVAELKKRQDVAKKLIVTHNEQIKALQQPKDGGVEGL
jgi:hypothetical protein